MTENGSNREWLPAAAVERSIRQVALALVRMDNWGLRTVAGGVTITEMRLRFPADPEDESQVIVKGRTDRGLAVIGFHRGSSPSEAIRGAAQRIERGQMVWVGDKYAGTVPAEE